MDDAVLICQGGDGKGEDFTLGALPLYPREPWIFPGLCSFTKDRRSEPRAIRQGDPLLVRQQGCGGDFLNPQHPPGIEPCGTAVQPAFGVQPAAARHLKTSPISMEMGRINERSGPFGGEIPFEVRLAAAGGETLGFFVIDPEPDLGELVKMTCPQ